MCRQQHHAQEALALLQPSDASEVSAVTYLGLGFSLCGLGDYAAAATLFYAALRPIETSSQVLRLHECLFGMALVLAYYEARYEQALEIASLVAHHWATIFWHVHPLVPPLLAHLQEALPPEVYEAAWERGKSLDLDAVVEELLAEFGEST